MLGNSEPAYNLWGRKGFVKEDECEELVDRVPDLNGESYGSSHHASSSACSTPFYDCCLIKPMGSLGPLTVDEAAWT